MFPLQVIIDFLQVVGGLVVIGGVLDALTKGYRRTELTAASPASYRKTLELVYQSTFVRFFDDSPISRRYILRSSALATLSLIISIWLVCFVWNSVRYEAIIPNPFFGVVLFAGYLFMAWLSLSQTRLFAGEALEAKYSVSRFIYLISDVIVSTNLFLYLYAGVVAVAFVSLSLFVLMPESRNSDTKIVAQVEKILVSRSSQYLNDGGDNSHYRYSILVRMKKDGTFETANAGNQTRFLIHSSSATFDPDVLVPDEVSSITNPSYFVQTSEANNLELLSKKGWSEIVGLQDRSSYEMTLDVEPQSYLDMIGVYRSAFNEIDALEDQLFNINEEIAIPAKSTFNLKAGFTPWNQQLLCYHRGTDIITSLLPGERNVDCYDDVFVVVGQRFNHRLYLHHSIADDIDFFILLSPIFLGTMLPSMIFYFSVLSAFILRAGHAFASRNRLVGVIYETAPFSASGMLLAFFVWFFLAI